MNTTFNGMISPTRGVEYTLEDLLKKALVRSEVIIKIEPPKVVASTAYGDKDFTLTLNARIGDPVWSAGIAGVVEMQIPAHTCANRNFTGLSFQCGDAFGEDAPDLSRETSQLYIHASAWLSEDNQNNITTINIIGSDVVDFLNENETTIIKIIERELLASFFMQ